MTGLLRYVGHNKFPVPSSITSVDHNLHTIKITGHLTFDSKHKSFRAAFRDFTENPNNEGIQLQITDMLNTDLPSLEIGAKISISRIIESVTDTRFAQVDKSKPQVVRNTVENVIPIRKELKTRQTADENSSDLCFY